MNIINQLENKIYKNENINLQEYLNLSKVDNLKELCKASNRICKKYNNTKIDLCSIMNAKCGACSEDCKYCAQSSFYNTSIKSHSLVSKEDALKLAKENEKLGINRFSLVTSGAALKGEDFENILEVFKYLKQNSNIKLCASLGIISYEQLVKLKEAGVTRYHHNLETSRDNFSNICTTHTYEHRIQTILKAQKAGIQVCSGGIIGMGETMEHRIKMALDLKKLQIKSIPINVLTPIKGTPLENTPKLSYEEILRTIAIFRFINPKAFIRFAGGRLNMEDKGERGFLSGINGAISGNYLTTNGNGAKDDVKMINKLGLKLIHN
ncbi:biotin synthase [Clostridium acetireducens DSM 10703]|uniref:Biotin synthase n=1 Tax=Clostridium acetireducens DSM 10703 TaxID=1121290 RepID=A0A1E8F019_9CLOT|nr:biotin synthase BioB [Clostridium acetireducens]OFI06749.1 biotin synthase [Clostridium acetireducens DSM 10703]